MLKIRDKTMNGILNIIKPPGMTSFDVVYCIRKATGERRVGHSGTLDPGAAGVLPVFVGRNATKTIEYLDGARKSYRAVMRLGVETDTMDAEGKIINIMPVKVKKRDVIDAALGFTGEIEQIPPMYSAVKQKGKKLYELARSGITVARNPRKISIYSLHIIEFDKSTVIFDVVCSGGTYIRTLCSDIGKKLGCGAYMAFLVRTAAGPFTIGESITIEEALRGLLSADAEEMLLPTDYILRNMKLMPIGKSDAEKFKNGMSIPADGDISPGLKIRICTKDGELLGVALTIEKNGKIYYRPEKIFSESTFKSEIDHEGSL